MSTQSKERTTRLIRAIAEQKIEPVPYHNLVLAAECLRDVGSNRVQGDLENAVQKRLRQGLETPPSLLAKTKWLRKFDAKDWIERRRAAMEALVRVGAAHWTLPYGEPEWVEIPAGEFWMGSEKGYSNEKPAHKLHLNAFLISRVPITNAQYHLFVQATAHRAPEHWQDGRPPKGKESHSVVNVSWDDAIAYCQWLSQVTEKTIALPSEAEWEKAARGDKEAREYPWGETFDATRCNCSELGLGDTTPVGIFPNGASPYGVLEMSGNVWEWTRCLWGKNYPYDPNDGREQLDASRDVLRVLRGGAFYVNVRFVRCAARYRDDPFNRVRNLGFRVVLRPLL
ncbi:formylglycine-generating enzyme family protein [candidate division KSB1 bacterium]|nr:formylglycine-generating enzyme family protein [candidate division KSB1 bacterium]